MWRVGRRDSLEMRDPPFSFGLCGLSTGEGAGEKAPIHVDHLSDSMRVLTFNSHQPYLHSLATAMPWQFGVVIPRLPTGEDRLWDTRIRPQPDNVRLYPSVAAAMLEAEWDWILTHNVDDLLDCRDIPLPKVFLVHGTLRGRAIQDRSTLDRTEYLEKLRILLGTLQCRVVYISELKKQDFGIPGRVIPTAINPTDYGGYRGVTPGVLQVSNHLRERGCMLGWQVHAAVCHGIPYLVLGQNRNLPGSRPSTGWNDLKEQYRTYRVYLHTAVYPYEDGFNLALMEAMATGMPVATIYNPTSPIEDGVEGVVGNTADELRDKVIALLERPEKAYQMGQAALRKLKQKFPLSCFQSAWQSLAAELA